MRASRAAMLILTVLCTVGSAWAGTAADDFVGIHKKLGGFTAPTARGATRCFCVHGDPEAQARRMLLYRDEATYPVDCTPRSDAVDASDCRQTGGSVLSIDQ